MDSAELKAWLGMLARQGDGRIVIVPGGGIFADAVREAQRRVPISDAAAHHMALLAMDQYGLVLKALQPDLVTATSELEISERSWQHRAIVWLPSRMVLADDAIPQDWSVTSDSLAAWLARKLNASRLVLVKHADSVQADLPIAEMTAHGLLDDAFPQFAAGLGCPIHVVGRRDHDEFERAFNGRQRPARAF